MTLGDVLQVLVQCLDSKSDCTISWEQFREWPEGAGSIFQKAGWIKPAVPAAMVECPGCEENCFMPVHVVPSRNGQPTRAYVACDLRDDMGRVKIPLTHLEQWQVTRGQIARFLTGELGLKGKPEKDRGSGTFKLGNVQGKKRLGCLGLNADGPVCLKAHGHLLPLSEAVFFQDGQLKIDRTAIIDLVDRPTPKETPDRHQTSTARREVRKLDTHARHGAWQKEARALRKKHPDKSERWIAQRIETMTVANNAKWETIRKMIRT